MRLFLFLGLAGAGMLGVLFLWDAREPERIALPPAREYTGVYASVSPAVSGSEPLPLPQTSGPSATETPAPSPKDVPEIATEVNLAIPFTSQAPHQRWDVPYKEFCEEASVLMAASYIRGEDIPNADVADAKLLAVKAFEEQRFGYYEDTTAEETAVILREYYGIARVEMVYEPDALAIKKALSRGRAVIVPAAGRMLGNPYYTQPGPLYHMLVVKGYTTDGKFITNDPGTRRGADFLYEESVLLNAIHDWNGGNVNEGRRVMIVVG